MKRINKNNRNDNKNSNFIMLPKVDYCFKSANNKPNISKELESFTDILDESIDVLITNSNIINILDELM